MTWQSKKHLTVLISAQAEKTKNVTVVNSILNVVKSTLNNFWERKSLVPKMEIRKDGAINVVEFKPVMKAVESIKSLTIDSESVCLVKADGEFNYLVYDRKGETYTVNRWNRKLSDFPALNEFAEAMKKTSIQKAELLVELYGKENGRPVSLPNLIHFLKGGDTNLHENICIGIFDIISVNGLQIREPYHWKLEEAANWVKGSSRVHVLPWIKPESISDIEEFWKEHVEKAGYEGIVVRNSIGTFKVKPLLEMDAAIIGINKKSQYEKGFNLFDQQQVTSMKLGLLNEDQNIVEVGDVASGITVPLRKALWKLMEFKVGEDKETVFVKPMVVVTIRFNAMYPETTNRVFRLDLVFNEVGTQKLVRLRHPKLVSFRKDKTVCLNDVGLNQIPEWGNEHEEEAESIAST